MKTSKVKPDGTHIQHEIVVRRKVSGFHGTVGYNNIMNITTEMQTVMKLLQDGEYDEAEGMVDDILGLLKVNDE